MSTIITARATRGAIETLNDVIALELDVLHAVEEALDRLEDEASLTQLCAFVRDHRRHIDELRSVVTRLGGQPAGEPKSAHGRIDFARVAGDKAILQALRSKSNEINNKYERAAVAHGLDPRARAMIEAHLQDERRHRAWIVHRLETLAVSGEAQASR